MELCVLDIFSVAVWHERDVQICLQPVGLVTLVLLSSESVAVFSDGEYFKIHVFKIVF